MVFAYILHILLPVCKKSNFPIPIIFLVVLPFEAVSQTAKASSSVDETVLVACHLPNLNLSAKARSCNKISIT